MNILLATDAFPPVCGGSGWSTYELAAGLRARGHEVTVVRPRVGRMGGSSESTDTVAEYDGFVPIEFRSSAPGVPFARNYFKNERLWASLATRLAELVGQRRIDVVHAQHVLTGPAAIAAARDAGVPVVCTIRDYWPLCYWSDLVYDTGASDTCPACTVSGMVRCLQGRGGPIWPVALPMIPYMRGNLARKRRALTRADAIVAVSTAVARLLHARGQELAGARIETIPNMVDVSGIRSAADGTPRPMPGPYALFVGKLEANKGITALSAALARSGLDWPLVVVGDGRERGALEAEMRRQDRPVHVTGWLPRADVLSWMRHASFLVFPSFWPEPLSRVLIEASALGVPIAALDTGGTRDIVEHEHTGLLASTADTLGDAVRRLRDDEGLRIRLGRAATDRAVRVFDREVVVARFEHLYRDLVRR
jgi:glycosyltransferase involved in cell wall biosynthesis